MYRFVSHGGALAPAPGMEPLDPVQDDGIPVLTEVWKLEDDEPAADCTGDTQHAMPAASDNPQAYQPDVLAGMRAALSEVMERLAPERVQSKVEGESLLDRLLPMSRQAKQWRAFTERYREIRSRIDQESGEAVRDACEVELAKLPARVKTLPGM